MDTRSPGRVSELIHELRRAMRRDPVAAEVLSSPSGVCIMAISGIAPADVDHLRRLFHDVLDRRQQRSRETFDAAAV